MCRSIVVLRRPEEPASEEEIRAAALQFVRKISGYRKPAKRNEQAFERAVEDIADASRRLLDSVGHFGTHAYLTRPSARAHTEPALTRASEATSPSGRP